MPRPSPNRFNPRGRFEAILNRTRGPETPEEIALAHLLHDAPLPDGFDPELVAAVNGALGSFEAGTARTLFDACLLGKATAADLREAFGVAESETAAYRSLFFDRGVFPNDFHVISFISSEKDAKARELLREGYTKGFRALRFKYAPSVEPASPETTLQRIFEADSQLYMQQKDIPLTNKSVKELRSLGKHVVTTAQVLTKFGAAREVPRDETTDFVIESGPENPTLKDLLAQGIEIIR